MALPQLTMTGNLTADPELRFTPSGAAVANFTVACSKRRKNDATGEWEDVATCFLACTVWKQDAEAVAEELTKGTAVTVVGSLKQRSYEDRDGNKRSAFEVDVYTVAKVVKSRPAERAATQTASEADPWSRPAEEPPY